MAKNVGMAVVVDFSSAAQGFKQLNEGMSKSRGAAANLGNTLSALGAEAGQLGRILGGLGSVLAAGSLWGAAAAGISLVIDAFRQSRIEAEAAAKAWKDSVGAMEDIIERQRQAVRRIELERSGMPRAMIDNLFSGDAEKVNKELVDAGIEFNKARAAVFQAINANPTARSLVEKEGATAEVLDKLAKYYPHIADLLLQMARAQERLNTAREAEAALARTGRAQASADKLKEDQKRNETGVRKAERDAAELKRKQDERNRIIQEHMTGFEEEGARAEEDFRRRLERSELLNDLSAQRMSGYEEEGARMPEYVDLKAKDLAEGQRKYNEELQQSITLAQSWGNIMGTVLGELATGQMTAGQAFAAMASQIVQQLTTMAVQQITSNAAVAGSEAFKSQAGIPVIGPAMAVAAMGTAISTVLGLLAMVSARQLGGPVVGGVPYLVGERGPELMVPSLSGRVIPAGETASILGGSTTKTTYVANFHGPATRTEVERWFRDMGKPISKSIRHQRKLRRP